MGRTEPCEPAPIGIGRYCIAVAIYRRRREPHSAPARRSHGDYQRGAERSHENPDDRFGGGNSSGFNCRHLWNEFQEYAGIKLGVGLSVCPGFDCCHDANSVDLV